MRKKFINRFNINKLIGVNKSETNRTIVVPKTAMNNYELDLASGAVPEGTTFEEWRELQKIASSTEEVLEYGDNV